jgi:DNA-binding MarR family transcriptional regulator
LSNTASDDIDARLVRALLQFNNLYRFSKMHKKCKVGATCEKMHFNLKYSEFLLLFYIRSSTKLKPDGVSASELSVSMNVKPPTINPLLLNLENLGLIERRTDQNDRRFVRIELTPAGMKFTNKHETSLRKRVHELTCYLGVEKSNNLANLMNEVYTYFSNQRD